MSSSSSAAILLGRQYKQMQTDKDIPGISCGLVNSNVFEWEVMLMLEDESGGLFGECAFRPYYHLIYPSSHLTIILPFSDLSSSNYL